MVPPQGVMRTFIANNGPPPEDIIQEAASHNETWSWYPDDAPKRWEAGATRAPLPLLPPQSCLCAGRRSWRWG